jgi:CO/xanthine dehydrogenase Mo-binding subunit
MKYVGRGFPGMTNRVLVSGQGTFTADIHLPGICAVTILRSPYAHARVVAVDTKKAEAEPGVTAPLGAIPAAIEDALPHLKLALMETPLTPDRVWRAMRVAQATS